MKLEKSIIGLLTALALFSACDMTAKRQALAPAADAAAPEIKILSFWANKTSVTLGDPVELVWDTKGASQVVIDPTPGSVPNEGYITVIPKENTTYTLKLLVADKKGVLAEKEKQTIEVKVSVAEAVDPDPNPDEATSPCDKNPVSQTDLEKLIEYQFSKTTLIEGYPVTLNWIVKDSGHPQNVTISINDVARSTASSGSLIVSSDQVASDAAINISVNACGVLASKTDGVNVRHFESWSSVAGVQKIFPQDKNIFYVLQNGDWLKATRQYWDAATVIRKGFSKIAVNNSRGKKEDSSQITSLLELSEGCPNTLFAGSENGYLYRSIDNGKTFLSFNRQDKAMSYHGDANAPDKKYPIKFIAQDPKNKKVIYVASTVGLAKLKDCGSENVSDISLVDAGAVLVPPDGKEITGGLFLNDAFYLLRKGGLLKTTDFSSWKLIPVNEAKRFDWIRAVEGELIVSTDKGVFSISSSGETEDLKFGKSNDVWLDESLSFAGNSTGLYLKQEGDSSWYRSGFVPDPVLQIIPTENEILFLGASGRVWFLENEGGDL